METVRYPILPEDFTYERLVAPALHNQFMFTKGLSDFKPGRVIEPSGSFMALTAMKVDYTRNEHTGLMDKAYPLAPSIVSALASSSKKKESNDETGNAKYPFGEDGCLIRMQPHGFLTVPFAKVSDETPDGFDGDRRIFVPSFTKERRHQMLQTAASVVLENPSNYNDEVILIANKVVSEGADKIPYAKNNNQQHRLLAATNLLDKVCEIFFANAFERDLADSELVLRLNEGRSILADRFNQIAWAAKIPAGDIALFCIVGFFDHFFIREAKDSSLFSNTISIRTFTEVEDRTKPTGFCVGVQPLYANERRVNPDQINGNGSIKRQIELGLLKGKVLTIEDVSNQTSEDVSNQTSLMEAERNDKRERKMVFQELVLLTDEDIEMCLNFAFDSWVYHQPHKLISRSPSHVWYDVLQGKLSELLVYKYCKYYRLLTNLKEPNFEILQPNQSHKDVQISLHDLVIENKKKEVKSKRELQSYVILSTDYFINGKYKYGDPDDLIFIDMGLEMLPKVQQELANFIENYNIRWNDDKINSFFSRYKISENWVLSRYQYSNREELFNDYLILAMADNKEKFKEFSKTLTKRHGEYKVAGEVSVDEFYSYARRLKVGYVFNTPPDPEYNIFLNSFLSLGLPIYTINSRTKNSLLSSYSSSLRSITPEEIPNDLLQKKIYAGEINNQEELTQLPNTELKVRHFTDFVHRNYDFNIPSELAQKMFLNKKESLIMNKLELKPIASGSSYRENLAKKYNFTI